MGLMNTDCEKQKILNALQTSYKIRSAVSELSELQDRALLHSVGICIDDSDTDSDISANDSDACFDDEQIAFDMEGISKGIDVKLNEGVKDNFQIFDDSKPMNKQIICENSVTKEIVPYENLCDDSQGFTDRSPLEQIMGQQLTPLSCHPGSCLKEQPVANSSVTIDVM